MLSVFGSEANGAGDGLANEPVAFRDSSKGRAPSAVLGTGFTWLHIFEICPPPKIKQEKKKSNLTKKCPKYKWQIPERGAAL